MGDIKPNLALREKRLQVQLGEMELNLNRIALRRLELDDEHQKLTENEEQIKKTISQIQQSLKG